MKKRSFNILGSIAVVNFPDDSQNGLFGPNNPSKDRNDQDLYSMSFPGGGGRFFYGTI